VKGVAGVGLEAWRPRGLERRSAWTVKGVEGVGLEAWRPRGLEGR